MYTRPRSFGVAMHGSFVSRPADSPRYRDLICTPVFRQAVVRLGALDITGFKEPRPSSLCVHTGAVEQGKSPWLNTLLDSELLMHECCCVAQSLDSPLRNNISLSPSVESVVDSIVKLGHGLPSHRRQVFHEFRLVSTLLLPLSKEMKDSVGMPEYIRAIAGDLHVALIAACVHALSWRDTNLPLDLMLGMYVLDCPDSGCHRLKDQPASASFTPDKNMHYVRKAIRHAGRLGRRCSSEPSARAQALAVWAKTLEEEAAGHVVRSSEHALNGKYGAGAWRCMFRFGVFQDGKWRCCDNAAASEHNDASHLRETINCVDCNFPAAVAIALARRGLVDSKLCTDDIAAAYRKVGNAEPMYTVFVVWNPIEGRHVFFETPGFNFGLKSAVVGFNRFPEFCVEVARRLFAVACAHFFDDYTCVDPKCGLGTAKEALWLIHDLFGFPLSTEKSQKLLYENAFLGVICDLADLRRVRPVVRMRVKPKRVDKLRALISGALSSRRLTSADASRLRGKLYFLTTTSFGRVGRAPLQALVTRQYFEAGIQGIATGSALEGALVFFLKLLDVLRPRVVQAFPDPRRPLLVWTDAMFEPARDGAAFVETWVTPEGGGDLVPFCVGSACVAFVVYDPESKRWVHGSAEVGLDTIRHFVPGKKTYIGQLEALAACAVYFSVDPDWTTDRDVIHWIDNQSTLSGFVKGYSGKEDTGLILNTFSLRAAELGLRAWFEFAPSAQNIADVPSRRRERPDILDSFESMEIPFVIPDFKYWSSYFL